MKILVLSLLRVGDVILSAPVLQALRQKYPEGELHLLINRQSVGVTPLLPFVDKVHCFDRSCLQQGLGEASVPFFNSYGRLAELVDEINCLGYDAIINFTQNKLSGWLMSVLDAPEKIGLVFDAQGRPHFGSPWFSYLNDLPEGGDEEGFHMVDILRYAVGIEELSWGRNSKVLVETEKGRLEAQKFFDEGEGFPLVAVQALTSDSKKNWGLSRYAACLSSFFESHRHVEFAILTAPFEHEILEPWVAHLRSQGLRARLAEVSLEGAFSLLQRARVLLTGDTSLKHLAGLAQTQIVELSLGSSDYRRTGAYGDGSIIIQSRIPCAPCEHSNPCHRESHFCAAQVPTEAVALILGEAFERRWFQLPTIADEFQKEIEILRVHVDPVGDWCAVPVLSAFSEVQVCRLIDRATQKLFMNDRLLSERAGTEILRLAERFQRQFPEVSAFEWKGLFVDLERQISLLETRINGIRTGLRVLLGGYENPKRVKPFIDGLVSLREKIRQAPMLQSSKVLLDRMIEDDISAPFVRFRKMTDAVSQIEKRTTFSMKMVRGLMGLFDPSHVGSEREAP